MQPETVWDYPRPPRIEPVPQRIRIVLGGALIADTRSAWRVLETSHPPTYYLPFEAFTPEALRPGNGGSVCEWKGRANYWTITGGGRVETNAGWSYPNPLPAYAALRDHVAVYAGRMDGCTIDEEQVTPQPGGFYGGWITRNLVGPFKGAPGTLGW